MLCSITRSQREGCRTVRRRGQRMGRAQTRGPLCCAEGRGLPRSDGAAAGLEQGDMPTCILGRLSCVFTVTDSLGRLARALSQPEDPVV